MNNCKGYFLLDAMIGLSVFTFMVLWIVPQMTFIYEERLALKERNFGMELCYNLLQHWTATNEEPNTKMIKGRYGTKFDISWITKEDGIEICVDWKGKNNREESICGKARD
ncbi:hypothetical protein [Alkalihalobacillus sp. AL-G]|uniref:hypothetical protein n=1 Tax=Alkalihalobacillus sp. AL-G TaxID=2926399 RepID=UPI00272BEE37|nr:hypothetical protein [Alkalihalobacillus sp. AL-G]WLD92049.1 hypothetical protein MOJ78_13530 [Alkalihalobacillus sp. AL-G]